MVVVRAGQVLWSGPLFSSMGGISMAEDPAFAKRLAF
jgi:hypothetical protein